MAKKSRKRAAGGAGKRRRAASTGTAGNADATQRAVAAALALAADGDWRGVSMAEIADHAGLSAGQLRAAVPTKAAVLGAVFRHFDAEVAAVAGDTGAGDPARDRLFDVLMRRFDAMAPHRAAIAAIAGDLPRRPLAALCLAPRFLCSMASMLEIAEISSTGIAGALRTKGLAVVYLQTLGTWLTDDSADMAPTMAALDKGLRRAEGLATLCRGSGVGGRPAEASG